MGLSSEEPFSLLFLSLTFFFTISGFFLHVENAATTTTDTTKLIFKGCADQKFQDPSGESAQTLRTLTDYLVSQSMNASFSSTTAGEGQSAIYGLYQCRGDLSTTDCYNCVSNLPNLATKLCGKAVAVRIQLNGCYLRYEIVGFKQVPSTELLYKVCGSTHATGSTDFAAKRDTAFDMVVKGVESGGAGGFYTGTYQSVYVLGQCQGDLSSGDCGDCVSTALEDVKAQCSDSISGQVYLQKCFISYSYYPNGVPTTTTTLASSGTGQKQGTEKTIAIVVGGVAALGFVIACLLFIKSVFKKRGGGGKHMNGGYY